MPRIGNRITGTVTNIIEYDSFYIITIDDEIQFRIMKALFKSWKNPLGSIPPKMNQDIEVLVDEDNYCTHANF